ncbi:MAG: BatA domain-containing protein [Phycisphaeraceae bacterium]|nr:BatA domain-containing protein [Phycisphaeraceae bacterium]
MTFLNPILAAVGLACIALPILIHILMRRRRSPILWGAMRFLLEAYRQHRRRIRLEQFLLLASRCLLVALIALALGRPVLEAAGGLGGRSAVTLYLLIDNSLAASAQDEGGKPAIDRHRAAAGALLAQLDAAAGDRVAVIALGGPARAVVDPPAVDAGAVSSVLRDLGTTDSAADIPGALRIVASSVQSKDGAQGRPVVAILSDFYAGSADAERRLEALIGPGQKAVTILASAPATTGPTNISIAAVEPERPVLVSRTAGQTQVRVVLRRAGEGIREAAATTVRFSVQADSASGRATPHAAGTLPVRWQPGQAEATAIGSVDLLGAAKSAGASGAAVLIASIDNDAIAGDNTWRRPIEVTRTLRVGVVSPRRIGGARAGVQQFEPADWIRLALEPSEGGRSEGDAEVIEVEPITLDAARLAGLDAAFIARPETLPEGAWKRLKTFADQGGFVLVFPAPGAAVPLWADAMVRDLSLPWTISRQAREWPEGIALSGPPGAPPLSGPGSLLSVIAPELSELARPVRVFRALGVDNAGTPLLVTSDGAPILVAANPGAADEARGVVALGTIAFSFDWTDLQAKPLMVPLIWELVKQGVGAARGSWSALAGDTPAAPPRAAELRGAEGSFKVASGRAESAIRRAGLWRAVDDQGALRGLVVVNADPRAGRTDPQPQGTLGTWLGSASGENVRWLTGSDALGEGGLSTALSGKRDASRWVLPLLIGAMGLALLELALARWFSHATIAPPKEAAA